MQSADISSAWENEEDEEKKKEKDIKKWMNDQKYKNHLKIFKMSDFTKEVAIISTL